MINNQQRIALQYIVVSLLVLSLGLSACQPQVTPAPTQPPLSTSTQSITSEPNNTPTFTATPEEPIISMTINGAPYMFSHPIQIIGGEIWMPSIELFQFLNREEVSVQEDFISTRGNNLNGQNSNCHFWLGQTGENTYTADTEGTLWYSSDIPPFTQDGEVYLSEKMIEVCIGDFIEFDAEKNQINLDIPDRKVRPMQENSPYYVSFYKLKDASELVDSRIGSLVSGVVKTPVDVWASSISGDKLNGFTRSRFTLNSSDCVSLDSTVGDIETTIPTEYIELFKQMKQEGIKVRSSLSFWDLEYRKTGGTINKQRLSSEEEVLRYLDYVRMVVTQLKGLVDEYELWNEPDANDGCYQRIEPEDYIAVAKRAIPIIREIDPDAKIVLAATSSYVDIPCQEYTKILLESDILPLGDIISLHTVNNDASPVFLSDYYYGYDAMWDGIKKMAEEHGFKGEYYADELNYRSHYSLAVLGPEEGNYHPYEPEISAKYFARMIAINQGMNISVGTSGTNEVERPVEAKMIRNMAYLLDGLKPSPFELKVDSESDLIRHYTFKDDAGNLYVFIWNDGEAMVESQDVSGSILINGKTAGAVIAYDPYLMNMQGLAFDNIAEGIKLDNLLLRDYPLLYKIELR